VTVKVIERVLNEKERAEQQERERLHKEKEEERQARIALQAQSQPVSSPKAIQQRAAPRDVSPVVAPQGTSVPHSHSPSASFTSIVHSSSLFPAYHLWLLCVTPR
jgi:cobalamin-dependent methionine synthase I